MLETGMTAQKARDMIAQDLKCSTVMVRTYRHWANTENGRKILRQLTLSWRSYGVEPPFAEVIPVGELFPKEPISA